MGAAGGVLYAVSDLPPSNPNPAYQCPTDAPTQFSAKVDDFTSRGWKVTVEWRPTGVNVTSYVLEQRRRERNNGPSLPPTEMRLDGRPSHTLYLEAGIVQFRVRANCPGGLWSLPETRNIGEGHLNGPPDPPPPAEP